MNLIIDKKNDSLYLKLSDSKVLETEEVSPGVMLDFSAEGQVVGIEMLGVSKNNPEINMEQLLVQNG